MKTRTSRDSYTFKFTAPSFTIANTWKQLTSLSVHKLTDWFVEVSFYVSSWCHIKNHIRIFVGIWKLNLDIMNIFIYIIFLSGTVSAFIQAFFCPCRKFFSSYESYILSPVYSKRVDGGFPILNGFFSSAHCLKIKMLSFYIH